MKQLENANIMNLVKKKYSILKYRYFVIRSYKFHVYQHIGSIKINKGN